MFIHEMAIDSFLFNPRSYSVLNCTTIYEQKIYDNSFVIDENYELFEKVKKDFGYARYLV